VPPLLATLAVCLVLRVGMSEIGAPWVVIALGLMLAYFVFIVVAWVCGVDADDLLIARAAWARLQRMLPRTASLGARG
jgi:hypothetical protein